VPVVALTGQIEGDRIAAFRNPAFIAVALTGQIEGDRIWNYLG